MEGRDSFSSTLKTCTEEYTYGVYCVGAWSFGGNMITARQSLGGLGTPSAAVAFGGSTPVLKQI
jgi:hypothetical protein